MSDTANGKPTMTFWVLGTVFILWNLIGLMFYYMQVTMTPEVIAENFNEAQQAWLQNEPTWATAAYAIAVTAGVIGAALFLLRNALALPFFVLSFVAVLVQDFNAFILSDGIAVWGTSGLYLPAMVIVICITEIIYSRAAKRAGTLK